MHHAGLFRFFKRSNNVKWVKAHSPRYHRRDFFLAEDAISNRLEELVLLGSRVAIGYRALGWAKRTSESQHVKQDPFLELFLLFTLDIRKHCYMLLYMLF